MRYVVAKAEQQAEDKAYRIYVTDGLKMIAENTQRFAGGSRFERRFWDVIKKVPEETRTSDEIIQGIRDKISLLGG